MFIQSPSTSLVHPSINAPPLLDGFARCHTADLHRVICNMNAKKINKQVFEDSKGAHSAHSAPQWPQQESR